MTIRLLTSMAGKGFVHSYGDVVDLDEGTEERLIATGQAERIKPRRPEVKAAGKPKKAAIPRVR